MTDRRIALQATTAAILADSQPYIIERSPRRRARRSPRRRRADKRAALKTKADKQQAAVAATLANLPGDIARERVLGSAASAAFWGVSTAHWRRMWRSGKAPPPIRIGERKLGWRIGALVDALKARERTTSAA